MPWLATDIFFSRAFSLIFFLSHLLSIFPSCFSNRVPLFSLASATNRVLRFRGLLSAFPCHYLASLRSLFFLSFFHLLWNTRKETLPISCFRQSNASPTSSFFLRGIQTSSITALMSRDQKYSYIFLNRPDDYRDFHLQVLSTCQHIFYTFFNRYFCPVFFPVLRAND